MPYIDPGIRKIYDRHVDALAKEIFQMGIEPGDITYVVYRLGKKIFKTTPRYKTWSAIRNALEDSVSELRRRIIDPYEDKALERNGDVE